jgi:hypothetical protein
MEVKSPASPRGFLLMEKIKPGIKTPDGKTYYPTGDEWLIFFAINGQQWAINALKEKEEYKGLPRNLLEKLE